MWRATARLTKKVPSTLVPEAGWHFLHLFYRVDQAAAEDLSIAENLIVNKEQRIPDIAYFRTTPDPASTSVNLLLHSQEFHTSYWGHLGLLNLTRNLILPDYAGYPNTPAASLVPTNADVADLGHQQQALVGYVHPFDVTPDPSKDESLTNELPVDVALDKVDYIEVLGFSDHKSTAGWIGRRRRSSPIS